ncbi:hypothetical protein [Sphingosinicella rhizophila]|uniref:Uncharacterized protein n=1 Tax=Sphingosinicella rhizophila TaxID=3050082 RepID=A0ABU3QAK4_9SPHN|nr:hypothetical protein [Sphingosinicella sp. GR2756]MDT9600438.1 hypothetical protein [Sphingosinicella sp. GR2756]
MTHGVSEGGGPVSGAADLATRLARLDAFEAELVRKAAPLLGSVGDLSHADFFVVGATRRTLAQARGFKQLIEARNFPCAAAILRLQIDTAMRINALFLVEDMGAACRSVLDGARFNTLRDRDGIKLADAHLRARLAEEHPWISPVYERASDFVHLSGRHFYTSIAKTDDTSRIATFTISGEDPPRPEEAYFEVVDAFLRASTLVGTMILAYLSIRTGVHRSEEAIGEASEATGGQPPA